MAFICQTNRFPSFLFQFGCTVWCDCENFYRVIWSNSSDTNLLIVFGWFHMYAFCLICAMVSCALNMIRVPWQSEKKCLPKMGEWSTMHPLGKHIIMLQNNKQNQTSNSKKRRTANISYAQSNTQSKIYAE